MAETRDVLGRLRRPSAASALSRPSVRASSRLVRATSTGSAGDRRSSAAFRETSAFEDFMSDESSDEDEQDDEARALARMQQQADDMEYVPDDALFRLDSPNAASKQAARTAPGPAGNERRSSQSQREGRASDDGADADDDDSGSEDGRDSDESIDASFGGGNANQSFARPRASDEHSGSESDGSESNYIEENDDSFIAVNRPAFIDDDDDDDEEEEDDGRKTVKIRETGAFEAALDSPRRSDDAGDEQVAVPEREDRFVTVSIVEHEPEQPAVRRSHVQQHEEKQEQEEADDSDDSFASASPEHDAFLNVNDSFVGVRPGSVDSGGDRSFMDDVPRPTHTHDTGFEDDIDASFRMDGYGDSFSSMHNDSYVADHAPYADEHIDDNHSFANSERRFSAQDDSFASQNAPTADHSFAYSDWRPSTENDSYVAQTAPALDRSFADSDRRSSVQDDSYVAQSAPGLNHSFADSDRRSSVQDDSYVSQSAPAFDNSFAGSDRRSSVQDDSYVAQAAPDLGNSIVSPQQPTSLQSGSNVAQVVPHLDNLAGTRPEPSVRSDSNAAPALSKSVMRASVRQGSKEAIGTLDNSGGAFAESNPRPSHGGMPDYSEDVDSSFRMDAGPSNSYDVSFYNNDSFVAKVPETAPAPITITVADNSALRIEEMKTSKTNESSSRDATKDAVKTPAELPVVTSVPRDSGRPVDFMEFQHEFDEEKVLLHEEPVQEVEPAAAAAAGDDRESGFDGQEAKNSLSSSTSSYNNFFVGSDRGSDAESYSNSISDSFASMVIMGDTALDDASFVGARRSDVSAGPPSTPTPQSNSENLDRSYSNLIDRRVSNAEQMQPGGGQSSRVSSRKSELRKSAARSSTSSGLSASSASVSSASSDDMSFVSFNGGQPPVSVSERPSATKRNSIRQSASSTNSSEVSDSPDMHDGDAKQGYPPVDPSFSTGGSFVDASFASSWGHSAATVDHRDRRGTRSDEIEAGDVVQGTLPSLQPVLKIGVVPTTSGSIASPSPSIGSFTDSDVARSTDEHLDFTGVYRGSVNSLEGSRVGATQAAASAPSAPPASMPSKPAAPLESKPSEPHPAPFTASQVRLARSVSDSVQRESERKVEDFFRRTYKYQKGDEDMDEIDDDIRWTTRNRATRSRTTVIYCVDEEEEEERGGRNRSSTIATTKIIDLKNLKAGQTFYQKILTPQSEHGEETKASAAATNGKRRGSRFYINEDLLGNRSPIPPPLRNEDLLETKPPADDLECKPKPDASYAKLAKSGHNSSGHASTVGSSIDDRPAYASATHFNLSPRVETTKNPAAFFSGSKSSVRRVGNRRADNLSLTPSLTPTIPRISMDSSSHAPSPYTVAMLTKSPGLASGFKWQQDQHHLRDHELSPGSSISVKESIFRATGFSRPTISEQVANHVQQLSSSLRNTVRRAGARLFGQSGVNRQDNGVTSPGSTCPAPPQLPQGFDERDFYSKFARRGGVEDPNDPIKPRLARSARYRKKRNMRILRIVAGAVLGLILGIILTQSGGGLAGDFNLDADSVHNQQDYNGELVLSLVTRWMLLPGRLFLRVWNCVTMPLLFCYAANGVADMAMGNKESRLLSFRTIGTMLFVSVISTLEGIGAMAITNRFGWFQSPDASKATTIAAAASLEASIGTAVYADGAVGLLCSSNNEYLQLLDNSQFNCSNTSIPLPVYDGASPYATLQNSSGAIFALQDVSNVLTTHTDNATALSARYYPQGISVDAAIGDLLSSAIPNNSLSSFAQSSALSIVAVALIVGLFAGRHAFRRVIAVKNAMKSSHVHRQAMMDREARQPYYLLGALVELQLALEWILEELETYVAPIGVLSLFAGNMVVHYQEWQTLVTPMTQLILAVLIVSMIHMVVVMPVFMKLCFKTNVFKVLAHFFPAFLFTFCTGSVVLTTPVAVQCFADAMIVTRSMSQSMMSLLGVLHRNGNALYFPLVLLWLMETNTVDGDSTTLDFSGSSYAYIGLLAVGSCFAAAGPLSVVTNGVTSRGNLAIAMAVWRAAVSHSNSSAAAATAVPPTFALLVMCDVILSRVVNVVNTYDHLVVTQMMAEYCDEKVMDGAPNGEASRSVISPVFL